MRSVEYRFFNGYEDLMAFFFTNDKLDSFGGYGVMKIAHLQRLLQYICRMGFEHHVAVNKIEKADAIAEALDNYMGWDVYQHR